MNLWTYDYYLFASAALVGTLVAAVALLWALRRKRWRAQFDRLSGIAPQFMNVLGVLFALNLAFLANDTWNAHDRALAAVDAEADALRSIAILASHLPPEDAERVSAATRRYATEAIAEWPLLARRQTSPDAANAADALFAIVSSPGIVAGSGATVSQEEIALARSVRDDREARLALSQTHVNPFKWAGMAFLGFLTMLTVALVHVGRPRAMLVSVTVFALASAPTAAIVLIHGNPFQPPAAVSPAPLADVVPAAGAP